ncbi:amidohydrolase [Corticicoccus populi]|uniref:Amidohydrolase n=1 Tax=Corticicoccus populi TaxID=1812821 RepID=A0ABW5WXA2_9STAP
MSDLKSTLIEWRRDFHKHPEVGFLEMRTASLVAKRLTDLGYEVKLGREVMNPDYCMGKPDDEETAEHYEWAKENGALEEFLPYLKDGYTGVVGILDTKAPGPTVAYRVDMDALPIYESTEESHVPKQKDFRSVNNYMHACGHDAHTTIGLGLATLLSENKDQLRGKIKLIFQPAEEGVRGARSMVEAGVVDDVDYFMALHIGTGVPFNEFLASNNGYLATSKLDVTFKGLASHAGGHPEEGKNAMLAAASAVLNLHAIPRHSGGSTRVNVGELHAGSGRNVIADSASLKVEIRGENSELNAYMKNYAEEVIKGAALMHQVDYDIKLVGEAVNAVGSVKLAEKMFQEAEKVGLKCQLEENKPSGSEDATYFINAVQKQGGYATYCVFGTNLAAGHHNEKFDIDEESILPAVQTLFETTKSLTAE